MLMAGNDTLVDFKSRITLSSIIGQNVPLKRNGQDWFGKCPFHNERSASFSVNDKGGFYHCFGCGAHGDILDWWQATDGLSFAEACNRLRELAGIVSTNAVAKSPGRNLDDRAIRNQELASEIWASSLPITGTLADTYLRSARMIGLEELPGVLRFHDGLQPNPRSPQTWPAMIAAVSNDKGSLVAIQRTFLAIDGLGKAPMDAPKRSLGPVGQGMVKLAPAMQTIGIAEGVETGLSAMELFRLPVWCALGSNLAKIELPPNIRNVVIFADQGKAGLLAAQKAFATFRRQDKNVALRLPQHGDDWNDHLKAVRNER